MSYVNDNSITACLGDATTFVVFMRIWYFGYGIDVAMWWKDASGSHRRIAIALGSTAEDAKETLIETAIPEAVMSAIVKEFGATEIGAAESQVERLTTSHYNLRYGWKLSESEAPKWIDIAASRHRDERVNSALEVIYNNCPEVFSHLSDR